MKIKIPEFWIMPIVAITLLISILLVALCVSGIYFGVWTITGAHQVLYSIHPLNLMLGALGYLILVMYLTGMWFIYGTEDE